MTNNTEQRESREAEALRLADWLDLKTAHWHPNENKAADMLRALVADLAAARAELVALKVPLSEQGKRNLIKNVGMVTGANQEAPQGRRYRSLGTHINVWEHALFQLIDDARAVEAKRNEVAAPTQQDDCDTVDRLLRGLGLDPERCRTDAGFLNVSRTLSLLHDGVNVGDVREAAARIVETLPLEIPAHKYSAEQRTLMSIAEAGCRGAFAEAIRGMLVSNTDGRDVEAVCAGAAQAIHETLAVHKKPFPSLSPELQSGYLRAANAAASVFRWPRGEVAAPAGGAVCDGDRVCTPCYLDQGPCEAQPTPTKSDALDAARTVTVPSTMSADEANKTFGEAYGVDWAYPPTNAQDNVRLREAIKDAADEYSRYIVEDTAPITLSTYMLNAFDAAMLAANQEKRS